MVLYEGERKDNDKLRQIKPHILKTLNDNILKKTCHNLICKM